MTKSVDITRVIAGGTAIAAGFAGASQAQDTTGFYAGLGYGVPSGDYTIGGSDEYSFSGSSSSLFAGYNHAMGEWVLGAELGFNSSIGSEFSDGDPYGTGVGETITLKARVGRVFGRTLVYGSLGFASSDLDVFGTKYSMDGTVVGAGVETGIGSNGFVGLDFSTYDFNSGEFSNYTDDISLSTTSIRAGFRF